MNGRDNLQCRGNRGNCENAGRGSCGYDSERLMRGRGSDPSYMWASRLMSHRGAVAHRSGER